MWCSLLSFITAQTSREVKPDTLGGVLCLLNKECVSWCLTVYMHRWYQFTQDLQPTLTYSLPWVAPSFLHAQIDTWCTGGQTASEGSCEGGAALSSLQRCGPAVSRLILSTTSPRVRSRGGGPRPHLHAFGGTANKCRLRRTAALIVKSISVLLHKSCAAIFKDYFMLSCECRELSIHLNIVAPLLASLTHLTKYGSLPYSLALINAFDKMILIRVECDN